VAGHQDNLWRAVGLKCSAEVSYVLMWVAIKLLGAEYPPAQLVALRGMLALLTLYLIFGPQQKWRLPLVQNWRGLWLRSAVGAVSMLCSIYSITHLPLVTAASLVLVVPLASVLLATVFLKERPELYVWLAVAAGLAGTYMVLQPQLQGGSFFATAVALVQVFSWALLNVMSRILTKTESALAISMTANFTAMVVGLALLPLGVVAIDFADTGWLVLMGAAAGLALWLTAGAYRHAGVSVLAPLEYVSLGLGALVGYFVWDERLSSPALFGLALMLVANVGMLWCEQKAGKPA